MMANESERPAEERPVMTNGNHADQSSSSPLPIPTIKITKSDAKASFLRAARDGHLDKVLEHLKNNTDINTCNANGLNALHLASKEGHLDVVTELLKRGATVDAATKKGNTALHIGSLAGQEEVVKILVQSGASVNVQSQNGFTPLYMAAQENHDGVVRFLLSNGANQSLATEDGFTPLAVALQQGHDKVVSVLLENDTRGKVRLPALHIAAKKDDCKAAALLLQSDHNPDVTSKSGFTPLHIAAHYGNENIAALLVQKGADVNYLAKHHITPLHVAAKWGKANMVTLLLDKHSQLEAKTRDGLTPLHCAARSGHETVVDLLLERGAPISSKTKNGLAPLHMAAQGDHVDAGRILLHHKAPVDEVTVDYLTALHVAAHCGHVRVAKLLLDRKADPNARALNGFTPLHIACKKNRIKVVELLLKHGAAIEATTESGLTPLHVASFMGCMNIVIYLLQSGANANAPTMRGETPLHLAARANQTDIVRILLRNNATVDPRAREQQTPLHIASRLGNVDIVMLLLQHGADVDAVTKDMYTALHIAAKEGQDEVAAVLLDHNATSTAATKRGFTPLHLAAKYGNIKVAKQLIQKDAPVDAQGKNGVTPLHVASHYDHQSVALLLLDKGASPHAVAKNGYTPLHIAAKKNQMDIATTLLEYGGQTNAESKAGFTPLHLSAQEGHTDMSTLLIEHQANPNHQASNGLTPMHLCAQEDRVNVAAILVKNNADINAQTKSGYTPLHVASHFGQMNMVRFLLGHKAELDTTTNQEYSALHQAAQQGHPLIVSLLLEHGASPNIVTSAGQTPLSIAQKLGYITVIETLKIVTETTVTTTTTTIVEEKYRVQAPETMQETFMSDSEDEGGEDGVMVDQSYRYLTVDEMKSLGDDSMPMDGMNEDRRNSGVEETILSSKEGYAQFSANYAPDNVDLARQPVSIGFLVSFMVDARGGAMRGCRHSGVRVIIPPRKAPCPMRITCRYLKRDKLVHPPPLMEGEALASRILELGPNAAKFLGPVIIEVPHFAALRGKEREIIVLRSDNGETWREHTLEATEEAVQEVLNESFDGEDLGQLEDMNTHRITRILTTDFPQYFAIVSRIRQEVHAIGPDGGMVSSTVVPQVQAVFPPGALTKKIKVGLQAQPIQPESVVKMLGNRVAVSPIVTVEPRRRKFHRPITLTIPVPQAAARGMINQYSGDTPTLRLLCSITGGTSRAQWEDVTGSTPLTFVNDCVSFTTTVSARFWLMDCRNVAEAAKMATDLYREAIIVPFMAKFVVFAKRHESQEARLRVFCMTDDKEEKTLEQQEHFVEVAKSRDVEVLEAKSQYLEFAGNLVPITKSGEQPSLTFRAFRENRLPFTVRVKDHHADPIGRIAFMREARAGRGEPPQTPICNLNIVLPSTVTPETLRSEADLLGLQKKYGFLHDVGLVYNTNKPEAIHKADLRLSDICNLLGSDWIPLSQCLEIPESDVAIIQSEYRDSVTQQAMVMLKLWMTQAGNKVSGNALEKALRKIGRDDIVNQCIFNVELVTDDLEKAVAKTQLDQTGFDNLRDELGVSRGNSTHNTLQRNTSLDVSFDEQDLMKDSESIDEIPERRDEEERYLAEEQEVFHQDIRSEPASAKETYGEPASPRLILQEEKGICDSREAEKDVEIPQPVQEPEVESIHVDADTWSTSTRQSTMEERVIDRYVIDTHTPVHIPLENTPLEQEAAAQVVDFPTESSMEDVHEVSQVSEVPSVSTAPEEPKRLTHRFPEPVEQQQEEEEPLSDVEEPVITAQKVDATNETARQSVQDEPEVLISSSWSAADAYEREQLSGDDEAIEREFAEALQHGDEVSDVLSAEVTRSFEQESTVNAKTRMSSSRTPPPSPFELTASSSTSVEDKFLHQEESVPMEHEPPTAQFNTGDLFRSEDLDVSNLDCSSAIVETQPEENYPAAPAVEPTALQDDRLTSAGNASGHQPLLTNIPPNDADADVDDDDQAPSSISSSVLSQPSAAGAPDHPTSRIPVLSKRMNLSRSVSEQPSTCGASSQPSSRVPVAKPRFSRHFSSSDHPVAESAAIVTTSTTQSLESSSSSVQENIESYSIRRQFWEEVASSSSTSSTSSRRETKSERSSMIVTDEFGTTAQRETKSERSSAVLSEEDVYEVGRYTVTKVSTQETVIDTSREILAQPPALTDESQNPQIIDQSSTKLEEIQTVEETKVVHRRGSGHDAEEVVSGSSHRHRIGREEYIYSSGDESVSLRAEDVESQRGLVLPSGEQVLTEDMTKSSKVVYKDGEPVFVEEFHYDQHQSRPDEAAGSPPIEQAPGQFEDNRSEVTGDSTEVNVGSQELPDIAIVHQELVGGASGESQDDPEGAPSEMAFVNSGFIGVDHIDVANPEPVARAVSPFEVPRDGAYVIGTFGPDFESQAQSDEEEEESRSPLPSASRVAFQMPEEMDEKYEEDEQHQPAARSRTESLDSQELETYGSEDEDTEEPKEECQNAEGIRLTPEEALQIAETLIEEIRVEAPKRAELIESGAATPVEGALNQPEDDDDVTKLSHQTEDTSSMSQNTEARCTEETVQHVVPEQQAPEPEAPTVPVERESSRVVSLTGPSSASSFDITDEDLRSSLSPADFSPVSEQHNFGNTMTSTRTTTTTTSVANSFIVSHEEQVHEALTKVQETLTVRRVQSHEEDDRVERHEQAPKSDDTKLEQSTVQMDSAPVSEDSQVSCSMPLEIQECVPVETTEDQEAKRPRDDLVDRGKSFPVEEEAILVKLVETKELESYPAQESVPLEQDLIVVEYKSEHTEAVFVSEQAVTERTIVHDETVHHETIECCTKSAHDHTASGETVPKNREPEQDKPFQLVQETEQMHIMEKEEIKQLEKIEIVERTVTVQSEESRVEGVFEPEDEQAASSAQQSEEHVKGPKTVAQTDETIVSPEQVTSPERETSTTSSESKVDSSGTLSTETRQYSEETSSTWTRKEEETIYYSAIEASFGGRSSRPASSDVEALLSAAATTACSSEYETAFSTSSRSSEFHSAISSVSSRDSMKSLESNTGGVASEASETIMASALELDPTDRDLTPTDASLDLNQMDAQFKMADNPPQVRVEPEGAEHEEDDDEDPEEMVLVESEEQVESPFEMVSPEDEAAVEGMVELDDDDVEDNPEDEVAPPLMKRSQEMTFHPEPKPLRDAETSPPATPTPSEESVSLRSGVVDLERLIFTRSEESAQHSTVSDATTASTVIEVGGKAIHQDTEELMEQIGDDHTEEDEDPTSLDAATITSRSGSLVSGAVVISQSVTISSSSITSDSVHSINTQITTERIYSEDQKEEVSASVPDINVQYASPIDQRQFSYEDVDVPILAKEPIPEVLSDQEDEGFAQSCQQFNTILPPEDYETAGFLPEELEPLPEEIFEMSVGEEELPAGIVAKRIDAPIGGYNYEMSFERVEEEEELVVEETDELIEDLERQKRWMERQFEEAEDAADEIYQQIPIRVQPLADIEEVGEDVESSNGSDRLVSRLKESLSSTPEFDVLSGRRYFTRSGDVDDMSVDSLQDFERLEQELQAQKLRRQSNGSGSQESLNGRKVGSRSSGGDNVSVNSLTEFERLERDMAEVAKLEERAKQQEAALLSEIEEGHESQVSESESCETLSDAGHRAGRGADTDESDDDYEQRMFEIDEIIRQAQTNIEQFDTELAVEAHQAACAVRMESTGSVNEVTRSSILELKTESVDSMESIEPDFLAGGVIRSAAQRREVRSEQPDSLSAGPDSLDVFGPSSMDSLEKSQHQETDSLQAMAGAESSSSSSSAREELPRDRQPIPKRPGRAGTCSSDSLEGRTSSSGPFDSDSIMSGSMTSSQGSALISSTETLTNPEFVEASRTVEMGPEIRRVTFRGPDADYQMKQFVSQFQPGEDVQELVRTDPATGSVCVTRVTQRRVVVESGELVGDQELPSRQAVEEYISVHDQAMEEVETYEEDDGQGNMRRVIRKRVVGYSDSTVQSSPPYPVYPNQSLRSATKEGSTLPAMTSSGAEAEDQAASAAYQQYDPTCSAISESEPSLLSQPEWPDSAQGGN